MLHRDHLGEPHLQLRMSQRLRGAALRVQGSGQLVCADEPTPHDGDGVDRGRRHRGRVPGHSSLLRRVGAAAPAREGAAAGGARPRAAGGRRSAARALLAAGLAAAAAAGAPLALDSGRCVPVHIVSRVHIDRLCVKLCGANAKI